MTTTIIMTDIENISSADALFDTLEHLKDLKEGDDNPFGNFGFNK